MAVNLTNLIKIFSEMDRSRTYFMNRKTGEILSVDSVKPDLKELKLLQEKINTDKAGYVKLPKRSPADNFKDMEDFILTLKDLKLRSRLTDALNSGGTASKYFRDQLRGHNFETSKWNEFKNLRLKRFALDFLKSNGFKIQG